MRHPSVSQNPRHLPCEDSPKCLPSVRSAAVAAASTHATPQLAANTRTAVIAKCRSAGVDFGGPAQIDGDGACRSQGCRPDLTLLIARSGAATVTRLATQTAASIGGTSCRVSGPGAWPLDPFGVRPKWHRTFRCLSRRVSVPRPTTSMPIWRGTVPAWRRCSVVIFWTGQLGATDRSVVPPAGSSSPRPLPPTPARRRRRHLPRRRYRRAASVERGLILLLGAVA